MSCQVFAKVSFSLSELNRFKLKKFELMKKIATPWLPLPFSSKKSQKTIADIVRLQAQWLSKIWTRSRSEGVVNGSYNSISSLRENLPQVFLKINVFPKWLQFTSNSVSKSGSRQVVLGQVVSKQAIRLFKFQTLIVEINIATCINA